MKKLCRKCKEIKPIYEFYHHPETMDGYEGKCKECHASNVALRRAERMKVPELRERELSLHRKRNLRYKLPQRKYSALVQWREKNKHKVAAHSQVYYKLDRKPCEVCGKKAHAHHEDYSKPLEVTWLCHKHHRERHIQLRQLKEYGRLIPI